MTEFNKIDNNILAALKAIVGDSYVLTEKFDIEPYSHDETEDLVYWPEVAVNTCISSEFKDKHPDIPWKNIIDIGDYLVRAPDRADPDIMWNHARKFVPELILKISALTRSAEKILS